jgi:hypothetical protein
LRSDAKVKTVKKAGKRLKMFDINKLSSEEYHASVDTEAPAYKLKLFMLILKVLSILVIEKIQNFFSWLFSCGKKSDCIVNQLALVTGGGNGLGRAICFRLAREKCDLAIVDIDFHNAQKTANAIMNQHQVVCRAYQCDISNIDAIEKLKTDIEREMRGIDILVNNAGLLYVSNFFTSEVKDIKKVVEVNLTAHIVVSIAEMCSSSCSLCVNCVLKSSACR